MAPVVAQTQCPFAVKARFWEAPSFEPGLSVSQNVRASLGALTEFSRVAAERSLDAFVYRFPAEHVGMGLSGLSLLMRTFVECLMIHDPLHPRPFRRHDLRDVKWRLSFAGVDYFAPVFSPVYGRDHSRYTYGVTDSVFVLMQPNSSFHSRLGSRPHRIRDNIRTRFEKAGQPYPQGELEAHKFVLPHRDGDPPVEWYELDPPSLGGGPKERPQQRNGQSIAGKSEPHQARRSRKHHSWC